MKTLELIPGIGPTRKHIRVISAAEQMLEALHACVDARLDETRPECFEAMEMARQAIAKATEPNYDRN